MNKRQMTSVFRWEILFLIPFLLAGCITSQDTRKKPLADVSVFLDLQQIDLDKDGKREIIAVYRTGEHSSGVRVIKFNKDKGDIIFERTFDTLNTRFKVIKGIPTIITEEVHFYIRIRKIYCWDGKTFAPKEKP